MADHSEPSSSSDYEEEEEQSSSTENPPPRPTTAATTTTTTAETGTATVTNKQESLKNYVTNLLARHVIPDDEQSDLTETEIRINPRGSPYHDYHNVSAFRQYHANAEGTVRTDAQRRPDTTSDEEGGLRDRTSTEQSDETGTELNLDPDPIIEERESAEQRYKQKVYLRQLQPPTPQPIEIQVQEVLLQGQTPKPPIHVRVGKPQPRTPSPIVIKSAPPPPPTAESDQPIVYNKYVPPPKQPPQQIIIHRHPDLPPKPRPIVVEQWLPYKPAPKRIIKHSLPPEARQTPPPPHNIVVSYAKPRALIEVELVRLPVVKIDPYTYQQMTTAGHEQLAQHPSFQHEQRLFFGNRDRGRVAQGSESSTDINWRI